LTCNPERKANETGLCVYFGRSDGNSIGWKQSTLAGKCMDLETSTHLGGNNELVEWGNRDREKPRGSPLPHHQAYGSVPWRFDIVTCGEVCTIERVPSDQRSGCPVPSVLLGCG
jgi:hypothetical protein